HKGVADRRSDKREAALLQILAHRVALLRARRHLVLPTILYRSASNETPDKRVERAEFFLYRQERLRIRYRRIHLQPIAHDAGILHQRRDLGFAIPRYLLRVEAIEDLAITLALIQNRGPTQPGLRALQNQQFEKRPIVVVRDTPFLVVIQDVLIS